MRHSPLVLTDPEPMPSSGPRRGRLRADGGELFSLDDPELASLLRGGGMTGSGAVVNIEAALKVATAWRCLHLICGGAGNLPLDLYRRTETTRSPAVGHPVRQLLNRPNGWQTPAEFRKMLTAHAVMRGDGYGLKITSRGRVIEIWPMLPGRVRACQRPDMTMGYEYSRADGSLVQLAASDVLHLRGLTWNGVNGVGVLQHAREGLGLSRQAERAGAGLFRSGIIGGKVFSKDGTLGDEAFERLKAQLSDTHAGAENAHKALILEDGLKSDGELMTAEDMQFLELREFQRSDVAMFFGVPPHMAGIVDKTTSWGSGIEQQSTGFVQYTLDDWLVMWEQTLARDLLNPITEADLYFRVNRTALLRGDTKARWASYALGLQWGVYSPNEIRAFEEVNPREDGDVYYDPPNTPGATTGLEGVSDEPKPEPS